MMRPAGWRRLSWRLAWGFGSLLGLMLLALALALWQIHTMGEQSERFATQDMQRLLRIQSLSLTTEGAGNALLHLMNAPRAQRVPVYAEVDERNRRIDGIVAALQGQLDDAEQEQTLAQLARARTAYLQAFIATVDQVEADDAAAALRAYTQQVQPALAELLHQSNALTNRERERVLQGVTRVQQQFERLTLGLSLLSVLAVLLAGALAMRIARSVVTPVRQLELAAQRIAQGHYGNPELHLCTEEFDRVGQALQQMAGAIAQREQQIEQLAFRDPLTGLPNRTFLLNLDRSGAGVPHAGASLLLFDLARLKTINETLGFASGDALISELAARARDVLRHGWQPVPHGDGPTLAYVAGGQFAVFLPACARAAVETLRQRLMAAVALPMPSGAHQVDLTLCVGLAEAPADPQASVAGLLRNAEVALGVAKRAALDHAWYNPAQEAARLSHLSLVSDLRRASAQSELQMWLQPKFSLQSGLAVGAEALVRWQHPTRGFVSPAEFVPFAEQTGAITQVTDWMLAQAMHTLQDWRNRHPQLSLSVNISTRDLQDSGFCQRVQQLMQRHQVSAHQLRLEIVESGLMHDAPTSIALLHRLRALGVQLSIDDFGTGHSSLAYLQQLPVSELKIDRSFVQGVDSKPASQQLVRAMIELGHGLGLTVTAEGIETQSERDFLAQSGCDVMQGYFASRPLYGAPLQSWLNSLSPTAGGKDDPPRGEATGDV